MPTFLVSCLNATGVPPGNRGAPVGSRGEWHMPKLSLNAKILLLGTMISLLLLGLIVAVHLAGAQTTLAGVLMLAAGVLASLGGLVWSAHRYVTRNVLTMIQVIVRLADGDDGTSRVPVLSRDEIGLLAEKFNLLLEQNRRMKAGLERLVDIKTDELFQANAAVLLAGQVFENVLEAIIITDREGVILRANPAFQVVTGYTIEEALGRKPNLVKSDRHPPEFYAEMWRRLTEVGHWQGEIWNRRKNGEVFPAMLSISSIRDAEGVISHYIGTMDDISLNKLNEERIRHLAFHDPLTGLANRVLFADRAETGLQRARRDSHKLAVLVLDLDGFKQVNDSRGHAVGDLLLIEIARRLQGVLRAEDTVARFGGDEFTALLPHVDHAEAALTVARKILVTIEQPVVIDDVPLQVSASIGVSVYPADGDDYQSLFEAADTAMYQAKSSGKAQCRLASRPG